MAEREKGTASATCPNCGADLKVAALPDGGMAAARCEKCYPATEKASKATAREVGTEVKES